MEEISQKGHYNQKVGKLTHGESELLVRAWINNHEQHSLLEVDFERAGNNINVQHEETGDTPLHNAVTNLHFENVEILLKRGANREIKNKRGLTPLQALFTISKSSDHKEPLLEMTKLLLQYGAKPVEIRLRTTAKTQWHYNFCAEAVALIDAARAEEEAQAGLHRGHGL